MPLFGWKSEYSVDVELHDEHQKKLFRILNALYINTMHSKKIDHVLPIIGELHEYTVYHFSVEEQFMLDKGFPGIDDHIARHRDFTNRIEEMYKHYRDNDLEMTRELIVVLGNWLRHHVLKEDRKYSKSAKKGYKYVGTA